MTANMCISKELQLVDQLLKAGIYLFEGVNHARIIPRSLQFVQHVLRRADTLHCRVLLGVVALPTNQPLFQLSLLQIPISPGTTLTLFVRLLTKHFRGYLLHSRIIRVGPRPIRLPPEVLRQRNTGESPYSSTLALVLQSSPSKSVRSAGSGC